MKHLTALYLARVLASLHESSAEHVGSDLTGVGASAGAVTEDGEIQAPQTIRVVACGFTTKNVSEAPNQVCKRSTVTLCMAYSSLLTATSTGVAPSRDQAAGSRAGTAGGQGHGFHVAVEGSGLAQLDQHDVVVQVVAVVPWVADDLGRVDELLSALVGSNVVLAHTHLNAAIRKKSKRELAVNVV